jgi:hypothetical protein
MVSSKVEGMCAQCGFGMIMYKDTGDIALYKAAVFRNKLFQTSFKPHFLFCHHSLLFSKLQSSVSFFLCAKHYEGQNEAKAIFSIHEKKILEEIYKGDVITKYAIRTLMLCF